MDPASAKTLANIAVQGVRGAVGQVKKARSKTEQQHAEALADRLLRPVEGSMLALLTQLDARLPQGVVTAVASALKSPDFEEVGRTIAVAVATGEWKRSRDSIIEITSAILVLQTGIDAGNAKIASATLVSALASLTSSMLTDISTKSKSEYGRIIDRAILEKNGGYLKGILDRTAILQRQRPEGLPAIAHFTEQYREAIYAKTSSIVPASLDNQKFVPIDAIYVDPQLISDDPSRFVLPKSDQSRVDLTLFDLIDYGYRVVVLGDPGAGKSTLAQRLTNLLSRHQVRTEPTPIPVIVTLRKYEQAKQERSVSLVEYIESMIREDFHLSAPPGAIEYLLSLGRCLIFFDGLDELLDTHRRREISESIESFAKLFSSTKVFVTSRKVGYWDAPLNPGSFTTARLVELDKSSVEQYANKWFSLQPGLTSREQREVSAAFLIESSSIPDIRANPLMLSLLCNVYRGARWIPQNRADLYERCALMLFERWDEQRGIGSQRVLRADARAALQEVAYSIFMSDGRLDPMPERALKSKLTRFWKEEHFERLEDAEAAAISLYKSWHGRAWVLTDAGTTADGERLYRFTHRTFLEYFTAVEIVRRNPSPSRLWRILGPNLREGGWDIVAQIAIQVLHENYRGARRKIYDSIASELDDPKLHLRERLNLLSFAARHFGTLNPPAANCRSLTRTALRFAIDGQPDGERFPRYEDYIAYMPGEWQSGADIGRAEQDEEDDNEADEEIGPERFMTPLIDLLQIPGHLGEVALDETRIALWDYVRDSEDALSAKAFVFGTNFSRVGEIAQSLGVATDLTDGSMQVQQEMIRLLDGSQIAAARLTPWGKVTFWAPLVAARLNLVSPLQAVAAGLTNGILCAGNPVFHRASDHSGQDAMPAVSMLRSYLFGDSVAAVESALEALSDKLGEGCFDSDWIGNSDLGSEVVAPFFRAQESTHNATQEQEHSRTIEPPDNLNAAFSASVLLAAIIENEHWSIFDDSEDQLAHLRLGPLQRLESAFIARLEPVSYQGAEEALREFGFDKDRTALLLKWATRKANFIRKSGYRLR
ncbi:NACHT domain-containing protein [Dactylosporangium sp. NPDC049140]|uniref:NACHT domain-containing protein n=1 Tax=Dactylosporangium sp. NPDC049140 TaxID=3155647 RepID=UPI003409350F